jgi:ribosomal protein S18 acetylase RimI-like enzyme
MTELPESLFVNPIWSALHSKHRHFAISEGDASRYPADVAPFAAVSAPTGSALRQLHQMLAPGELVYLTGESFPQIPELFFKEPFGCLQMVLPEEVSPPENYTGNMEYPPLTIHQLDDSHAGEMVALTTLAFPGYFRKRTCEMGSYFGVRSNGELIAMGGERFMIDHYAEISGVCTHPKHRGKGLAASLIWQLARKHRRDGLISWLHVGTANRRAIDLYHRMGFKKVREVMLHPIMSK